ETSRRKQCGASLPGARVPRRISATTSLSETVPAPDQTVDAPLLWTCGVRQRRARLRVGHESQPKEVLTAWPVRLIAAPDPRPPGNSCAKLRAAVRSRTHFVPMLQSLVFRQADTRSEY